VARTVTRLQNYRFKLSSGLFGLPGKAASVDWVLVNDATTIPFRVTVYEAGVGEIKTIVSGWLRISLEPGELITNANSVSAGAPSYLVRFVFSSCTDV